MAKKRSKALRIAIWWGLALFLMLATLRFYASQLEQEVVRITRSIEELGSEELSLKQERDAIISPNRIYNYCKDVLKMKRTTVEK